MATEAAERWRRWQEAVAEERAAKAALEKTLGYISVKMVGPETIQVWKDNSHWIEISGGDLVALRYHLEEMLDDA